MVVFSKIESFSPKSVYGLVEKCQKRSDPKKTSKRFHCAIKRKDKQLITNVLDEYA